MKLRLHPAIRIPIAPELSGVGSALLSVLFFTAHSLLVKYLYQQGEINLWMLTGVRFTVGLTLTALIFSKGGRYQPAHFFSEPLLIVRGIFGGFGIVLFYVSIQKAGLGKTTVIWSTYILFAPFAAHLFLREAFTMKHVSSALLGVIGMFVLFFDDFKGNTVNLNLLYAVGSMITSVIVIVIVKKLHTREHTATIFGSQCFYGLLVTLIPTAQNLIAVNMTSAVLLVLAAFCSFGGQVFITQSFKTLNVAVGSSLQMLTTLCILWLDCLLLGQTYSSVEIAGTVLVIASCLQVTLLKSRSRALASDSNIPSPNLAAFHEQPLDPELLRLFPSQTPVPQNTQHPPPVKLL
jgi:drug/metabolite transporter (DMT)-like permease